MQRLGRALSIAVSALLLAACKNDQALARSVTVRPDTLYLRPADGLEATGPVIELCLTLPEGIEAVNDRVGPAVGAEAIRPGAELVASDGGRTPFEGSGLMIGDLYQVCFDSFVPLDRGRRYAGVAVWSDRPLLLKDIRWWTGERVKLF